MTADFYCMQCRRVYDGESFPGHRCGVMVPCAMCGTDVPLRGFKNHRCVGEVLSSTVERDAASLRRSHPSLRGARPQPPSGGARPNHPSKGA